MDPIIRVLLHDIIFSNIKLFPLGPEKGWQKLRLRPIFDWKYKLSYSNH